MLIGRKRGKTKCPGIVLSKAERPILGVREPLGRNHGQWVPGSFTGRRGAGRMALVLVMGVLVLVGGLLLWLGADQRAGEQPAGARHQGQTTQPEQPALAANPRTRSSSPVGAAEPLQNGTTPDLTLNGGGPRIAAPVDRFSGRGKIRGEVFMADHSTPPKVWTLSATPSKTLIHHLRAPTTKAQLVCRH